MSMRSGIDIGGAFTDAISIDEKGNGVVAKSPAALRKNLKGEMT